MRRTPGFPDVDGTEPCRDDPELWFTTAGLPSQRPNDPREAEARAGCRRCPWLLVCREYAIGAGELGVWGATNETERRAIRRDRNRSTQLVTV